MTRTVRAWWGSDPSDQADALDSAHVGALLEQLQSRFADRPLLVDLTDADGNTMTVGVGGGASVALYASAGSNPPYLISTSNGILENALTWFDYGGSETEFSVANLLPFNAARRAAVEFAATGAIDAIDWIDA